MDEVERMVVGVHADTAGFAREVEAMRGTLEGSLGAGANYSPGDSTSILARVLDLKIADFDGDGNRDVVVANNDFSSFQGAIALLRGDGTGALAAPVTHTTGGNPRHISVGDFDGDGRPDLATTGGAAALGHAGCTCACCCPGGTTTPCTTRTRPSASRRSNAWAAWHGIPTAVCRPWRPGAGSTATTRNGIASSCMPRSGTVDWTMWKTLPRRASCHGTWLRVTPS